MLIQAEITSFALDTSRNTPVIILKEVNGDRTLPVPVGPLEASAIAIESLEVVPDKPLTIDLVKLVMEQLGGSLQRIVIGDMVEQSLQARIQVGSSSGICLIDCRPCDAIALALRCGVDIFIDDRVLDRVNAGTLSATARLRRRIRSIDTIEFGNYFLE
ncbi:MAG: bifunctional nuclease family protein [Chitinispirillaceae bacterium]|nr:bifunctional nuclease family protein [Chitinispirillaceae bacterium]